MDTKDLCRLFGLVICVSCSFGLEVVNPQFGGPRGNESATQCPSHAWCQVRNNDVSWVCCGDCERTACCKNQLLKVDFSKCRGSDKDKSTLGSRTLAIVIGSIVGSFVILLILNWGVKGFLIRRKNIADTRLGASRDERGPDGHPELPPYSITIAGRRLNNNLPIVEDVPSYSDIHLYNKVDHSKAQAIYYTVPGDKSYYGIVWSSPDDNSPPPIDVELENKSIEPPNYDSVVTDTQQVMTSEQNQSSDEAGRTNDEVQSTNEDN